MSCKISESESCLDCFYSDCCPIVECMALEEELGVVEENCDEV